MSWSLSKFPCRRWRSAVSSMGGLILRESRARFVLDDVRARRRKVFAPSDAKLRRLACLQFGCSSAVDRGPHLGKPAVTHPLLPLPGSSCVPRTLLVLCQQLIH